MSVAQLNEGGDKIVKNCQHYANRGLEALRLVKRWETPADTVQSFEAELVEVKVARCGRKTLRKYGYRGVEVTTRLLYCWTCVRFPGVEPGTLRHEHQIGYQTNRPRQTRADVGSMPRGKWKDRQGEEKR